MKVQLKSNITKERLLQIADYLEKNIREENFNMKFFWDGERSGEYCGTVGCVLGHTMKIVGEIEGLDHSHYQIIARDYCLLGYDIISYECTCNYPVEPVEINHDDNCNNHELWGYLFGSHWAYTVYDSVKETAKRFRDTVENGWEASE